MNDPSHLVYGMCCWSQIRADGCNLRLLGIVREIGWEAEVWDMELKTRLMLDRTSGLIDEQAARQRTEEFVRLAFGVDVSANWQPELPRV